MKILIATKNLSKFNTIKNMLNEVIDSDCVYKNLLSYTNLISKEEIGSNIDRARDKAKDAYNQIDEKFDAIIGIDDGIIINNTEYVSVKDHLFDIMVGDKIPIGNKIYITRAYHIITNDGREFNIYNKIPYIIRKKVEIIGKEGYQLNSVISTIDNESVLNDMSDKELNKYYLTYSIEDLQKIIDFINNKEQV